MLRLGFFQIYEKLHFPNISFQFLRMNLMFGHKVTIGEVNISSFKKIDFWLSRDLKARKIEI